MNNQTDKQNEKRAKTPQVRTWLFLKSQCWSALDMNWGLIDLSKKKLIIILICAEIAARSKIDFLPLTSTAGSRSLIEIFQKILFAQTFFLKHYQLRKFCLEPLKNFEGRLVSAWEILLSNTSEPNLFISESYAVKLLSFHWYNCSF